MDYPLIYDRNAVQIYKVNEQVYYRVGDLDKRRQCNGGFVVLKDCTAVIDVPSSDGANELLQESIELFGKPVKYAFITHAHPDHDLGLPVFARHKDITLIAAANAEAEFANQRIEYPEHFIRVDKQTELEFHGTRISVAPVGYTAHSPWDMIIYLPEHDLMFTGDLVACEPILYLESCCLKNWIRALEELKKRNVSILARGHGGCVDSGYLDAEICYLRALGLVNKKMMERCVVTGDDINDDFMGEQLRKMCREGLPAAKLLMDKSGSAAYYQLTQFYRYGVENAVE